MTKTDATITGGATPLRDAQDAMPETLGAAVAAMTRAFAAAGHETPGLDARRLAEHELRLDPLALVRDPALMLDAAARTRLGVATRRRLGHEPVSRIVGRRHFYGLELEITPATLDPRPETETLIDGVLELIGAGLVPSEGGAGGGGSGAGRAGPCILDLGTGTGAILIALLSRLELARGVGVDISSEALACAQRNLSRHGLGSRAVLRQGDWLAGVDGPFDLIVSNPPYIVSADIAGLAPDTRDYDPHGALDGGRDGLDAYRILAGAAGRVLVPGGWCLLEVGAGQSDAVLGLFEAAGFGPDAAQRRVWRDLQGIARCVAVRAQTASKDRPATRLIHAD